VADTAAAAQTPADSAAALLARAWELAYHAPAQALEIGRTLAHGGGLLAAEGWLHVALAEVRQGDETDADAALHEARQRFAARGDEQGLAWCDEVHAIGLRRRGEYAASARLQAEIDARAATAERSAMYRFVAQNSRAITAKVLGDIDGALRHFYAASEAAVQTGWAGPRIAALSNLGGFLQDLYNLDDARRMSEQALAAAREAGASQTLATSAANLIIILHASGEARLARQMAQFMIDHAGELPPGALHRYRLPLALGHLSVGEIDQTLALLETGPVSAVADADGMTMWAWLKARCLLARDDAAGARAVAERMLEQRRTQGLADQPYDLMELYRVLADACECMHDHPAALRHLREAHARYEQLVGRSARARYIALEVSHRLAAAQRERDAAIDVSRMAENDRRRLAELNAALQAQIAQTAQLHEQLREQALNDPLTGLHNRRYLFEVAPGLLDLARRQGKGLCVVLLDLDHFKLLNDTYGHQAGDHVLKRFASLLRKMLRTSDVVCRHGGEEFVAVMPDIDAEGAQATLARLLTALQTLPPEPGRRRTPNASFSAGIALFPRHGHTLDQLLSRADRALYAAKHHGRARIEQAPRTGFGTLA
jgi:diguanylate cyclase (GGDEF)-like protein